MSALGLAHPGIQHCTGWFSQWRTASLAALADDPYMGANPHDHILALQSGQLRDAKAGLHGCENKCVITSSCPGSSVRCLQQGIDLIPTQKSDLFSLESFVRNREHALNLRCVCRKQFVRSVAEKRSHCCQAQVSGADTDIARNLKIFKKLGDEWRVNLLKE